MKKVDVSIIVPVYNSSETLQDLCERITKVFESRSESYEMVLVDDGSKDASWKRLEQLKENYSDHLIAIQLQKNFGQHQAIVCGFNFSMGKLIITMDDDLQHPPEEIPKLLDKHRKTEADVVYGIYKIKKHGFMRSAGSYVIQKSAKYFAEHNGTVGSSFRLFDRKIVERIAERPQNFMFIDEIIHWYTGNIVTVMVEHHSRAVGKSGYSFFKLWSLYMSVTINYTLWPLRAMTYGGVILAGFSFVLGVYYILRKLFANVNVEGFTAIMVAVLFSTSLLLVCMGIVGQYLYKIYQNQNGKPPYTINRIL